MAVDQILRSTVKALGKDMGLANLGKLAEKLHIFYTPDL